MTLALKSRTQTLESTVRMVQAQMVFYTMWFLRPDTILNIRAFRLYQRLRGKYSGLFLDEENIETLDVTKRLVSRLQGQAYSLDGTFISPMKACFSVFLSHICQLTQKWDEIILK